jgi:hypothetical protein
MLSPLVDKSKLPTRSDTATPSAAAPRFAAPTGAPPIIKAATANQLDTTTGPPAPVVAKKLSWSDFPVVPQPTDSDHVAQTAWKTLGGQTGFTLVFDPSKSWSVQARQTDDVLRHEQYHLNLAAVLVNKANIAYAAGTMSGKEVTDALSAAMTKHQGDYETQTANGNNAGPQAQWEADIDAAVPVFPVPAP